MSNPRVRVYGHGRSEGSFVQVTRGMCRALEAAGEFAGFCPIDREADQWEEILGPDAPVSLNLGAPMGLVQAHRIGQHRSHWLLLAPNSESLPKGLMGALLAPSDVLPYGMLTGGLLAPSAWAASVLRRAVSPDMPVVVAPHGVNPDVHTAVEAERVRPRQEYKHGLFSVLHMTSSETARKSTQTLLRAWKAAKKARQLPERARLYVVMNPVHMNRLRWWCSDLGLSDADVVTGPGLIYDQGGIAAMYRSFHAICQPSRGEGFGLVPLEALACGVPVIATACTGHAEVLGIGPPGLQVVAHGENAPMDDFPGSIAPTVTTDAIREALVQAYTGWELLDERAAQNADSLRDDWTWEKKNGPAIRRMLQEAENVRK